MASNTIFVDDRIGSKEVAPLIDYWTPSPTRVMRLESADFCFFSRHGNIEDGPASIGIERKRIRDMVQSVMSGRLSGSQLPAMADHYDHIVLIVEGYYRCNPGTGKLEIPKHGGGWTGNLWKQQTLDYRALDAALNTLRLKTNVRVIKTATIQQTAMEVFHLWHWFTSKKWSAHSSHLRFPHTTPETISNIPGKASVFRRMCKELTHIGWTRSEEVEDLFDGNVARMAAATEDVWCLLNGITPTRAREIMREINGKYGGSR